MAKNKNGQVFSLWMVFITMAMIGMVVTLYYVQQKDIQSLVVSPMNILNERDALDIFEGREINLIKNSLKVASGEFGSNAFHDSFRDNFITGIIQNEEMKYFLFSNLSVGEVEIRDRDKNRNLVENGIYPKIKSEFNEDEFIFARVKVEKNNILRTGDNTKISFPLGFNYEFERKYLITMSEDKYSVRKI